MRVFSPVLAAAALILPLSAAATVRPHRHTSTHALVRHDASSHARRSEHASSGIGMSSERATEIQTALIQHGYLTGEPSGAWDASSSSAMQRLQSENGWQTKIVPDSRALIKLGLGPNNTLVPNTALSNETAANH